MSYELTKYKVSGHVGMECNALDYEITDTETGQVFILSNDGDGGPDRVIGQKKSQRGKLLPLRYNDESLSTLTAFCREALIAAGQIKAEDDYWKSLEVVGLWASKEDEKAAIRKTAKRTVCWIDDNGGIGYFKLRRGQKATNEWRAGAVKELKRKYPNLTDDRIFGGPSEQYTATEPTPKADGKHGKERGHCLQCQSTERVGTYWIKDENGESVARGDFCLNCVSDYLDGGMTVEKS